MRSTCILVVAALFVALPHLALAEETEGWQQTVTMDAEARQAEGLETVKVKKGSVRPRIQAMASVTENIARSVSIRPAGDGKVRAVYVLPGQQVTVGQKLVSYIDHSLHVVDLQLAQAKASLASAQANLADTALAYRRGKSLAGATVSAGEVSRRLAVMHEAQNAVHFQDAAVKTLTHRLEEEFTSPTERIVDFENSVLIAPVDGMVEQVGTAVDNDISPTDVVIRITSLETVWVVANVRPEDASDISIGTEMTFMPVGADPAQAAMAKVQTIEGTADPETGLVKVVATFSDPRRRFRPGTQLNAWLPAQEQASGLIVPSAAPQNVDGHMVVYRQTGADTFQPVPVRVLLEGPEQSVVSGDLKPDDTIVAKGSFTLKAMALLSGLDGD
ncbi:efflux RND transporter periplasmic adaptor subunit [Endobacter medicaginis]|uniref:Efflux RND transporter periplasmic adaptor subunit n=2 Tax=Endobacter medicaginis TaxID=1181271 RepID=A0A850NKC2_9PROT|nr:efflux RND transporter periplasmic adaptor subunit [Endobacter medicaginis]